MPTIYGYVHHVIGETLIASAGERLKAAGAHQIAVETRDRFNRKVQPELDKIISAAKKGDVIMVQRLYHLASGFFPLFADAEAINRKGLELVILDQEIDTRKDGRSIFKVLEATFDLLNDFNLSHKGDMLHVFDGNGGGGGWLVRPCC